MKIIVAGFPKTGTKSVNLALRILDYTVYDYIENVTILRNEWLKVFSEGWTKEDFLNMYRNVDAVTDTPTCFFWEEILEAFPDAKIILMTRDDESWYRSVHNQFEVNKSNLLLTMMRFFSPTYIKSMTAVDLYIYPILFGITNPTPWRRLFGSPSLNRLISKKKFREHNAHVLQNAPRDQLLVYQCSQGWEPLCKFLGVSIPQTAFPHENKRGKGIPQLIANDPMMEPMRREMMVSLTLLSTASILGGLLLLTRLTGS
ncbi:uncharacterized protein LOC120347515 [Styela clava]